MGSILVYEIRNDLHQQVSEILDEKSVNTRILRYAFASERKKSVKAIAVVDTIDAAVDLKKLIEHRIKVANNNLSELFILCPDAFTPIKYKIRIITAFGSVQIKERDAQQRKSITGDTLLEKVSDYLKSLEESPERDENAIRDTQALLSKINPDELYISAIDTGKNYQVSYFDHEQGKREHCSVCDILIVAGESISLVDAPLRKVRADRAEQIGYYYRGAELNRIYNFDKRYIKRRDR